MIAFPAVGGFSGMVFGPSHFVTFVSSLVCTLSGLCSLQISTAGRVSLSIFDFAGIIFGPSVFVSLVPSRGPTSSISASKRMVVVKLYIAS